MTKQSAAIPYRIDDRGRITVLLITSRTKHRWIIPKGKVGRAMEPRASAGREAFEEAGVMGRLGRVPVGSYRQLAHNAPGDAVSIEVQAFPLEVTDELPVWLEMEQRERRWFSIEEARQIVQDREISALLECFVEYLVSSRRSAADA
ncbi:NUDIX hydrolase [Sphingomonas profundi]|uniref:NUDIX hydrolase n=1 Tax=Alterirhizorhabdus profundi TaxID=2681549 RepID=UPI0012E9225C